MRLSQGGFRFAETMAGTAIIHGQRRDMHFDIEARCDNVWDYLRTGHTTIRGTVTVAGLAEQSSLHGNLWIRPILGRSIRYEFRFCDHGGRPLVFFGEKHLRLLHLPTTLTTLPGEIRDEAGRPVAEAALRFPMSTLRAFLTSFRPLISVHPASCPPSPSHS